jgi:homospermidine synthase
VAWLPTGPVLGNVVPHDETLTVQSFFEREVPCAFVYEPPAFMRAYVHGGFRQNSADGKQEVANPKSHELDPKAYDYLGALIMSDKADTPPHWCGIYMSVAQAALVDPTQNSGPTPLQVAAGVWTALRYILANPDIGDCFSEDLPSDFVFDTCMPWAGELHVRPAPDAVLVYSLPPTRHAAMFCIFHKLVNS